MNQSLAADLLRRTLCWEPPGCCTTFIDHPNPVYRKRRSVLVGMMIEHRFAFLYWLKRKQDLIRNDKTQARISDSDFTPPDLISMDWHDDCGGECDYIESELKRLNQRDEQEVALFCWAGLRPLNDGHIAPAIWLNALGNVYIIQKQRDDCEDESRVFKDRYGNPHDIYYFRSPEELPDTYYETNSQTGVIWDIDLDYLTEEEPVPDQQYTPMLSRQSIEAILSPKKEWMRIILDDLMAITVALEPTYTGGLSRSLELYRLWENVLFDAPLFSKECCWKDNLFDN